MRGLLYKDLCTLTSRYKKNMLFVLVLYLFLAIALDISFLLYALVFVAGLYVQSAIGLDEYSHWDMYGHTLPIKASAQVGSKYLLGILAIGAGCLVAFAAFAISPGETKPGILEASMGILAAATSALFYFSLSVPLGYRFGTDRARTVVVLVLLVLLGGLAAVFVYLPANWKEAPQSWMNWLAWVERFLGVRGEASPEVAELAGLPAGSEVLYGNLTSALNGGRIQWAIVLLFALSLVLFFVSWAVSTVIYRKKEY